MLGLTPISIKAIFLLMNDKVAAGKPLTTQPNITLAQLKRDYASEEACKALLRDMRWPDGVRCPRCNSDKVYALKARPFNWVCKTKECGGRNGYRFSVITKTIFENTNYPLTTWFKVMYLMLEQEGNQRAPNPSADRKRRYRTAWYMRSVSALGCTIRNFRN